MRVSLGARADDFEVPSDDLEGVRDDWKRVGAGHFDVTPDAHRDVAAALSAALSDWLTAEDTNALRDALDAALRRLPTGLKDLET